MSILANLAEQMINSQSFEYNCFNDAATTIERPFRTKMLRITYDRLSLFIYNHNLTRKQYWLLGKSLEKWLDIHNSDAQKKRIEYGILFQYALLHPKFQQARVVKEEQPDFIVEFKGETIGIEVTRLEKESDNVMSKIISEHAKPGMKANEILAEAFKKHGNKVKEYEIIELENGVFAIHHIESMLISADMFVKQIEKKLEKYKLLHQGLINFLYYVVHRRVLSLQAKLMPKT